MPRIKLSAWSVSTQRGKATVIIRGRSWVTGAWRQEVYKIPVEGQPTTKALVKAAIERSELKWRIPLTMSFKTSPSAAVSSSGHLEPSQYLRDDDDAT